jgi:hypothetical protein
MFRIISKDSKMYLEITSKYTKTIQTITLQTTKYVAFLITLTITHIQLTYYYLFTANKMLKEQLMNVCTVRQNKLFGDSTSLHLFIFIAIVFYDKVA